MSADTSSSGVKQYTAIYTVSVGRYGGSYVQMLRFLQHPGQTLKEAMNQAGYKTQKKGYEWDISEATVFLFEGWPQQQGESQKDAASGETVLREALQYIASVCDNTFQADCLERLIGNRARHALQEAQAINHSMKTGAQQGEPPQNEAASPEVTLDQVTRLLSRAVDMLNTLGNKS